MSHPVKIVALLVAKPGQAEALKALVDTMVEPSRAEPGNLRWDVWQVQGDPGRLVLDELYVDAAAVASHRETPHFKAYVAAVGDVAERTSMLLDPVRIA
ncbi:putative quinol monooxygenase [Rhodoplanes sp. TEM]|uniref:Quinol monooxygenase n=1 Tax=Rhodoplanes tepidamans TaxID=200616 RepID=A0ABT5JI91_RHOTP|nr:MULTISPECIES: putative quinol monooxygenase [Rhodoplanes]MDC7789403.1 putative quinol monooxygenase [Rhodoplanes tepidamans]MDC7986469.1 putative quinol monooxygenase [Rhodoplanes sp. TEM]MDQ0358961.1 quinol monooxygenase YgiN [Rhodoplanes tepidamans]